MTSLPAAREKRAGGFTLLELLVVLAILGLVSAIVVSIAPGRLSGVHDQAAARKLAVELRSARNAAKTTGSPAHFAVTSTNTARLLSLSRAAKIVYRPVIGNDTSEIVFQSDGSSNGGVVEINSGERTVARLDIDWLTGQVCEGPMADNAATTR